jgi:hypothetical protein
MTGSVVLGAELKRLRGKRTMREVAALTRSPPLGGRVHPISAATICQLETGTVMPTIWSLHALSAAYQVSAQHLLDCIVQEKVCTAVVLPETERACDSAFQAALSKGQWYDALALTLHGERVSSDEVRQVAWCANRALCLQRIGLRDEAIAIHMRCSGYPGFTLAQRAYVFVNLVDALMSAGLFEVAAAMAKAGPLANPEALDPSTTRWLLVRRARLAMLVFETGLDARDSPVREAQRSIDQARSLFSLDDRTNHLLLDVYTAWSHHLLHNDAVAMRDLRAIRAKAEAAAETHVEMVASLSLGLIKSKVRDGASAFSDLEHAASLAAKSKTHDEAFEASFELLKLARKLGDPREANYLKRCQRLRPLVQALTPAVLEYERLAVRRT